MITSSIVLYKTNKEELNKVLDSTCNSSIDKVYIIDNSPTDELKVCTSFSKKISYIFGHGNIGYGAAHNIAIKLSIAEGSKYHVVINPDITFKEPVIDVLSKYMDDNPQVGQVMPCVVYPDGTFQKLCKLLPTPFDLVIRRFLPLNILKGAISQYDLSNYKLDRILEIPSLSGCFMFLNVSVLNKVQGFDDRFFMYCEDFDLCRRIGQHSKVVYYPYVSVVHNYEKGSYKSAKLLKYHIFSAIKYFNKWGWFWDKDRRKINRLTLNMLKELD
jgi:GT2 family glycosyltransferase